MPQTPVESTKIRPSSPSTILCIQLSLEFVIEILYIATPNTKHHPKKNKRLFFIFWTTKIILAPIDVHAGHKILEALYIVKIKLRHVKIFFVKNTSLAALGLSLATCNAAQPAKSKMADRVWKGVQL